MGNIYVLGWLFLMSLCWGPSYLCIKICVHEIAPLTLMFLRVGIGALVLLAIFTAQGRRMPHDWRLWGHFSIAGLLAHSIPWTLFAVGEQYIDSNIAAILNGIVPAVTVILGHFVLQDEKLNVGKVIGIILGCLGLALMVAPTLLDGRFESDTWGVLAIVAACATYASAMVYSRLHLRGLPGLTAPVGQLASAAVQLGVMALIFDPQFEIGQVSLKAWTALGYMSMIGTAGAFALYYHVVREYGASALSSVAFLLPITGTLVSVVVGGETLSNWAIAAFAVIFAGMLAINRKSRSPQAAG